MKMTLCDGSTILIGKRKGLEMLAIWELRQNGPAKTWKRVFECGIDSKEALNQKIEHLQWLAEKRAARRMIADMCGTSYRAAMADMGLSRQ